MITLNINKLPQMVRADEAKVGHIYKHSNMDAYSNTDAYLMPMVQCEAVKQGVDEGRTYSNFKGYKHFVHCKSLEGCVIAGTDVLEYIGEAKIDISTIK